MIADTEIPRRNRVSFSILELAQMPLLKLKEAQRYSNLSRAELLAAIEAEELKATKAVGG